MAYDEHLANRVREVMADERDVTEKRMFGGLAFLIGGHLSVSVSRHGGLMVRVPPEDTDELTAKAHVERIVMRGREMDGWIRVGDEALKTKRQLQAWVARGVTGARALPPKR